MSTRARLLSRWAVFLLLAACDAKPITLEGGDLYINPEGAFLDPYASPMAPDDAGTQELPYIDYTVIGRTSDKLFAESARVEVYLGECHQPGDDAGVILIDDNEGVALKGSDTCRVVNASHLLCTLSSDGSATFKLAATGTEIDSSIHICAESGVQTKSVVIVRGIPPGAELAIETPSVLSPARPGFLRCGSAQRPACTDVTRSSVAELHLSKDGMPYAVTSTVTGRITIESGGAVAGVGMSAMPNCSQKTASSTGYFSRSAVSAPLYVCAGGQATSTQLFGDIVDQTGHSARTNIDIKAQPALLRTLTTQAITGTFPLKVELTDCLGNAIPGAEIAFASGSLTVSAATAMTDSSGVATVDATASQAGPAEFTATATSTQESCPFTIGS